MRRNVVNRRVEYAAAQYPGFAEDTVWAVAHTIGLEQPRRGQPLERAKLPSSKHPNEALIPWVARELHRISKEVVAGRLGEDEYEGSLRLMEAKLPQIAVWWKANRIDLNRTSFPEALEAIELMEPDEGAPVPQGEVIYKFDNGWTVQELTTPKQVFAEGDAVQNCLRETQSGPGYCSRVAAGELRLFSLRTPAGSPRVSMAYDLERGRFDQIFAKQNTALSSKEYLVFPEGARLVSTGMWKSLQQYRPMVQEFIREAMESEPVGLILSVADPRGLDLRGANLSEANLKYHDLSGVNLSGASLVRARLAVAIGSNLSGANLAEANLVETLLAGADLSGANLSRAMVAHSDLTDVNLTGANLTGASLVDTTLEGAVLRDADLRDAVLRDASLEEADLKGVKWQGADLSRVNWNWDFPVPRGWRRRGARAYGVLEREK